MPAGRRLLLPALWLLGGFSCLLGDAGGYGRKVTLQYNPGSNRSSVNLLHVRAVGRNDTLHYVWSSIGAPTGLLLYTRSESSALRVNWTKLLSPSPAGAIWIEPPGSVVYATAVVFTKVFEYNGANASAPSEELFYPPYDLAGFSWQSVNCTLNRTALTARFQGVDTSDPGGAFRNGTVAFQVTAYEQGGRDGPLPRLLHTANSSKVEFIMDHVAPRGNGSRFMLEVVTVEEKGGRKRLQSVRSIDDEYTPTIFEVGEDGPAGVRAPQRQHGPELLPVEDDGVRLPGRQPGERHPLPLLPPADGQPDTAGAQHRARLLRAGPGPQPRHRRHQYLLRRRGRGGLRREGLPELVCLAGLRHAPERRLLSPRDGHHGCGPGHPPGAAAGGGPGGTLWAGEALFPVRAHQLSNVGRTWKQLTPATVLSLDPGAPPQRC